MTSAASGSIRSGEQGRSFELLGLACLLVGTAPAAADDGAVSTLLFGSLDAGPSAFFTAGAKIALDDLDRDGFAVLASAGLGTRSERGPTVAGIATTVSRQTVVGAALVGYQWFHDWGVVAAYAGPEGSLDVLRDGAGAAVLPTRYGVRVHGEIWARPTDATLLTATAILGSTRQSAWTRVAWGYDLWGAYLGPEASLYVDGTGYSKWGLGLHATDVRIADLRFRISAGFQVESEAGGSPYLSLSLWQPW